MFSDSVILFTIRRQMRGNMHFLRNSRYLIPYGYLNVPVSHTCDAFLMT